MMEQTLSGVHIKTSANTNVKCGMKNSNFADIKREWTI